MSVSEESKRKAFDVSYLTELHGSVLAQLRVGVTTMYRSNE